MTGKITLFLAAVVSLTAAGCFNQNEKNDNQSATTVQDSSGTALKLNKGEKWHTNEEMKPFILDAETMLNAFIADNGTDYKDLAKKLEDKNAELVKSCTMKGESHDELHKWLYPHMRLIKALGKETGAEESKLIVDSLKLSFDTYHLYFQ